jgi:hypothetical protein
MNLQDEEDSRSTFASSEASQDIKFGELKKLALKMHLKVFFYST